MIERLFKTIHDRAISGSSLVKLYIALTTESTIFPTNSSTICLSLFSEDKHVSEDSEDPFLVPKVHVKN